MTRGTCPSASPSWSIAPGASVTSSPAASPSRPTARLTRSASLPARSKALLFAYGTLMRGYERHHFLAAATRLTTGHVRGRLLALRGYPGLVAGAGRVSGEV